MQLWQLYIYSSLCFPQACQRSLRYFLGGNSVLWIGRERYYQIQVKYFFLIEEKLFTVIEQIYEHLNELFLLKELYF